MKNNLLVFLGLFVFTGALHAQWGGKKIKGNGNMVTEERSVGEFEEIALHGWFDVEIVDGKEGEISIRGEENLLEYLVTEVEKGVLQIKEEKGYNLKPSSWRDGIRITVAVSSISGVSLSGSGDLKGSTLLVADKFDASLSGSGDVEIEVEADAVEARLSGSGDLDIAGKAKSLEIRVSGSGDVDAADLEARDVEVVVSGSADVSVHATDYLKARVSGSGDVSYKGNPKKRDTKVSGSGEVSKM